MARWLMQASEFWAPYFRGRSFLHLSFPMGPGSPETQSGIFVFTWPWQSNWVSRNGNWSNRKLDGLRLLEGYMEEYHLRILVYKDKLALLWSTWLSGGLFVWNVRLLGYHTVEYHFFKQTVQSLVISSIYVLSLLAAVPWWFKFGGLPTGKKKKTSSHSLSST